MKPMAVEALCEKGFTARMARQYLAALEREDQSDLFDPTYRTWAHEHGFFAESACTYGLNDSNVGRYLSDYEFHRLWPLNGWQRIWINDKLTLNAIVQGSDLERYVPSYFYYSEPHRLLPLCGSSYAPGFEGFLATLRTQGEFACKPCNGAKALGFHRLAYENGAYTIDGASATEQELCDFVKAHPNYVFTEYLHPSKQFEEIDPLIHTLRILVLNPSGVDPYPVASYLRFGIHHADDKNFSNYTPPREAGTCSYNAQVDLETGAYGNGKLAYANRVVQAPEHPITGIRVEGTIPQWSEVLDVLRKFSLKVGACEYLGFDIGMTESGPMVMEINSHTGVKYLQLFQPAFDNDVLARYYQTKMAAIDALTGEDLLARNRIAR